MHSKDTSVHSSHIGVQSLAFVHKPLCQFVALFPCARKVDEAKAFVISSIWLFLVCKYGGTGNV